MFGKPNMNAMAPPVPPPPPNPPTFANAQQAGSGKRVRQAATGGIGSTILTSGQGDLMPAATAKKSLLGA